MDKKNRTGLQSKISHIFAGVPIPKKRKPISEPPDHDKNEPPASLEPEEVREFPYEQFSIAQEPDSENIVELDETGVGESEEIQALEESGTSDVGVEQESSLEHLLSPQPPAPVTETGGTDVKKPPPGESKVEKPGVQGSIPAPPVREPILEKPEPAFTREIEIPDIKAPVAAQKTAASRLTPVEAGKIRDVRPSRKTTKKLAAKRQTSKTVTSQPKQKVMVVLFIVFSIVLVLVLGKNVGFSTLFGSSDSGVIEQPGAGRIVAKNSKNVTIEWPQPPLYPDTIDDPMGTYIPPAPPPASNNEKLVVRGISVSNGQYLATIGIEQKKEGDMVNGATIVKITENSVEFEKDGKTWTQVVGE